MDMRIEQVRRGLDRRVAMFIALDPTFFGELSMFRKNTAVLLDEGQVVSPRKRNDADIHFSARGPQLSASRR